MANIDFKAFIDEVKDKNPIEDVIEETNDCRLNRRAGREITGIEHQSLTVNLERGVYTWFSHNKEGGDVFTWMINRNPGWDFIRALEYLAQRAGMEMPQYTPENSQTAVAAHRKADAWGIAVQLMAKWLREDGEAWAYATAGPTPGGKPRYFSEQTIKDAGLGFTGRGPAAKEEMAEGMAGHDLDSPEVVAICGFKGDVSRWAHKWGIEPNANWFGKDGQPGFISGLLGAKRLVFPHFKRGRVIGFSSRNILGSEIDRDGKERKAYEMPRALVGAKRLYYNFMYSQGCKEVVIVEGPGDAVALAQLKVPAVAMLGLPGEKISEENAQELAGLRKFKEGGEEHARTIYIGIDADDPAHKALLGKDEDWPMVNLVGPMGRVVRWQADRGCKTFTILCPGLNDEKPTEKVFKVKDANDYLAGLTQRALAAEKDAPAAATPPDEGGAGGAPQVPVGKQYEEEEPEAEEDPSSQTPVQRVRSQVLDCAEPLVMAIATWAGKKKGVSRDQSQRFALGVIARLNDIERDQYRVELSKALGIQVREMDKLLKTLAAAAEKAKTIGEPVYTFGGYIDGWLVEYLYDGEKDQSSLAWRDPDGQIGSGDSIDIEGRHLVPYPATQTMATNGVLFPSAVGEKKSIGEMVAYCELFLKSIYLLPSQKMGRLISYWILSTWVYDCFETVLYLRAIGGAGSGKSEMMKRIGLLCYRTMTASGAASTSSLFRATERYKGVVFIDEADLAASDTDVDMIKFYNSGAMKNNPIWRTIEVVGPDGERSFEERSFQSFCPKLIAMRKEFKDDAVASRSLTMKLMSRGMNELREHNIPLSINNAIRLQAQALRNLLLRWRLETWQREIDVTYEYYDMTVSARLNQVAGPLLAIAVGDLEQQEDIRRTLREYYAETILSQSMSLEARVLEAIWKILQYPDLRKEMVLVDAEGEETIKVGNITKIANQVIDEMNEESDTDDDDKKKKRGMKGQTVGSIIRNDFQMRISDRKRTGFWMYADRGRLQDLSVKYGIDPADFGPQENEKKVEKAPEKADVPEPKPVQEKLV